jgi:acyl-CoA synthetase (AMP-forming)/AMP-acid ligase II
MLDAGGLIEKHRSKGVLIDTNLLVLLLVGSFNKRRIPEFKRTQSFTAEDFDILSRLIDWFGKPLFTTPHVLSQVSDLTTLPGNDLGTIRSLLSNIVEQMEESYDQSKSLVVHPLFSRFGLTDAAIASVCSRGTLVLTADLDLQLVLQHRGADALNFNHVRMLGWS